MAFGDHSDKPTLDLDAALGGLAGNLKYLLAGLAVLVLVWNSFESIGAGERGVVFSQFGGVREAVLGEGLRFKIPFIEDIIPMDVKIHKSETGATASEAANLID